ncbi:PRTRC system protein C [Mucilaginibacter sabulilitoris]|uniref:PRTRC system protein C n=1 Tax=Mucilaginibacter sabulilitoris TaxID=1173583 RepID=A0ABZ0TEV0_9SPHI|nr:PRTRC system protein C [Mucilaginibacter sabulilitoris]WPU91709.1 PRTRC system protein C [Mucilaginibacter sabulilitoris]
MEVTTISRVFLHKNNGQEVRLADPARPNEIMTTEDVRNYYANIYPILTTAKIRGPEFKDDEMQYHFETTMGTKG